MLFSLFLLASIWFAENVSRKGAKAVTAALHDAILTDAGIDTRVATRTAAQLQEVVARNPFLDRSDDPTKLSVTFLFDGVTPTVASSSAKPSNRLWPRKA